MDDEELNLDVLAQILKSTYTIYLAKSGQAAINRARKNNPDIILLDIIMPDMNGFEVLAELKKSDITRRIPVIFITGLSSVEDEEKGLFLGAVDYIIKPFHSSIVKARVKTQMQIVKYIRTIEQLGLVDVLTGMPNRRSFDNKLLMEWKRAARNKTQLSLLMIDVDDFKLYNDKYGHPQGDILLQTVGKIFMSFAKRPADFASRWGGEEFMVLLPEIGLSSAMKIAENIRAAVEAATIPFVNGNIITSVTVSVGVVSTIPSQDDSVENFMFNVDKALYKAKRDGKNRVCSH